MRVKIPEVPSPGGCDGGVGMEVRHLASHVRILHVKCWGQISRRHHEFLPRSHSQSENEKGQYTQIHFNYVNWNVSLSGNTLPKDFNFLETEYVCYITTHLHIIPEALFYLCGVQCHPWRQKPREPPTVAVMTGNISYMTLGSGSSRTCHRSLSVTFACNPIPNWLLRPCCSTNP